MKKTFALLLMVAMSFILLTGCGTDPVYEDLSNYLNVEMVEVNADYEKLTAEVGTWETLPDDDAIKKSIDDTLLPLVNGSIEKLKDINPETEEVKEIKDKYPECRELAQVFIDEFKDIEVSGKYNTSRHLVTAEDIMKDIDEINCKAVEVRKILSETLSNIPTTKTVRGLTETCPTIGYIVKNNGKEPIKIDRITIKPLGKVPTVLNPGQSIALLLC